MKNVSELASESLILSSMSMLADKVADAASHSLIGGFLTSYDRINARSEESLTFGAVEKSGLGQRAVRPLKRACIRSFENSRILNFIQRILNSLLGCPLKYYASFMLTFGIYVLITFGLRCYVEGMPDYGHMSAGIVSILLSLLMINSNRPLSESLCESRIASAILFGAMGARRETYEETPVSQGKHHMSFILGMMFGIATYFISPLLVILGIFGLVGLYAVLVIPEFGVIMIIFAAPFLGIVPHPSIVSALMVLYVAFCTFIKLIRGKRVLRLELSDGAVLLFLVLTILGGLFSASRAASISYAVIYGCLMVSYFLVVILIRTEEWVQRCVASLLISSTIVSLYGIYQNFLGTASTTWQDKEMFEGMGGRITSTFENPNVLAEYLIMCIPFGVALFLIWRGWGKKLFALCVCGAGFGALIFTMSRGAWLGFMIGILVFLLIWSRKTLIACFFGLLCVPLLPFVLPESIIRRFSSIGDVADSSTAYRVHIWEGCINMIKDFFAGGIGVGKEVFAMVYPSYTLAGIESAPHAHNLYLQIIIETGIFGLLVFVAVLILSAQSSFTFYGSCKKLGKQAEPMRLYTAAAFSGIIAVAAQGMTDYIWYNYRVFLMFWLMIGLMTAIRRTALGSYDAVSETD